MQMSWLIVLFGAEIAFAHQNVETYEFEQDCLTVSHSFKRIISLWVLHRIVRNFLEGEKPWGTGDISHALEIPSRLVNQILHELVLSGLVYEVKVEETKTGYEPAQDPEGMTIRSVMVALEDYGSHDIPVARTDSFDRLCDSLRAFDELLRGSEANRKLKDL
jgi:membrane protein